MPSYTITLEKHEDSWYAWCYALPECRGEGRNQRQAYMAIKRSIRRHLDERVRQGKPLPIDRTTTKFFRVDPGALRESGELR